MKKVGQFISMLALITATQALFAEPLNIELLKEAVQNAKEANDLRNEGKTVKSDRLEAQVKDTLKKYLKPNKKYTFPASCAFFYSMHSVTTRDCEGLEDISFSVNTENKAILEKLEDCSDGCDGEFILIPNYDKSLFTLYIYMNRPISLSIKFLNVKQIPKNEAKPAPE